MGCKDLALNRGWNTRGDNAYLGNRSLQSILSLNFYANILAIGRIKLRNSTKTICVCYYSAYFHPSGSQQKSEDNQISEKRNGDAGFTP
jgi:hypothetical protein